MKFKYIGKETGAKMLETFRWYRKVLGLDKEKGKTMTMTDKEYMLKRKFCISSKDNKGFNIVEFNELNRITREFAVKYAELLDDYIYKNIPTNVLQGMKLKIENELLERKLKNNDR